MPKLLLVDDCEMNRDMLTRRLTRKGYDVILAGDGQAGVDRARSDGPDCILMDMTLPVMNGTEATRMLKSDDATRTIPVIALTGHAMESDRRNAIECGFDDYDTKPVDLNRLIQKIEALLNRYGNHPQA